MRRGVVTHEGEIGASNVEQFRERNFVFAQP
jgi:hypothetical protein